MTDRLYTLSDITKCADTPYAAAKAQPTVERALDVFAQGLIDALKALPASEHELRRLAAREELLGMFDGPKDP